MNFENLQHQVVGIDIPKTSNENEYNIINNDINNMNNEDLKKLIEKYKNEIKEQKEKEENMLIEYNIINETNDKLIDKLNSYEIENEKLKTYTEQLKEELDKYLNKDNRKFVLSEDNEKVSLKREIDDLRKTITQNENEIEILNNCLISKEEQIKNTKNQNNNNNTINLNENIQKIQSLTDENNLLKNQKEKIEEELNQKNKTIQNLEEKVKTLENIQTEDKTNIYQKLIELEDIINEKEKEIQVLEEDKKNLNNNSLNLLNQINVLNEQLNKEIEKNKIHQLNNEILNQNDDTKQNDTKSNEIIELQSKISQLNELNNKLQKENEENTKKISELISTINSNNTNNNNNEINNLNNNELQEELKSKDIELKEALTKNDELTKMILQMKDIDSSTHTIISTKTYKDLKWYLLSKNQDNNYENYIWVPQTEINESEYTSIDRNSLENQTIPLSKFNEVLLKLNDVELRAKSLEEKNRKLKEQIKEKSNFDADISGLDKKASDSLFSEGEIKKVFGQMTEGNVENLNKKGNKSILSKKKHDDTIQLLKNQLQIFKEDFKDSNQKLEKLSQLFKDLLKHIKCDSKIINLANEICNLLGFSPNTTNSLIKEKKGLFGKSKKSKDKESK